MKSLILALLLIPFTAFGDGSVEWGDTCTKWFDYQGQAGTYEAMKQQASETQLAEDFPDLVREHRSTKMKYELAKKKYEKKSKKKFNPDACK